MNSKVIQLISLFSILLLCSCLADEAKMNEDRIKARQIWDRVVNHNEKTALLEASSLEASIVVPMLNDFAQDKTTDSERAAIALKALRQVQGYADYLRQDMADAAARGLVPGADFKILSIIATPEAAEVVAPYLFDFKTIAQRLGRDTPAVASVVVAFSTLEAMGLPDAPKEKMLILIRFQDETNRGRVLAWQDHAVMIHSS